MKKVLIGLLCAGFCAAASGAQESASPWDELNQTVKEHLINLINIDTSQPDPQELKP